jgi:hypothetical protein
LLGKRGLGSGVLSETIERIPTIKALMPIMKETKADGKKVPLNTELIQLTAKLR